MSCNYCANKNKETAAQYACLCDQFVHPQPLNIGAGLNKLPRQIATFHEFRRALLKDIKAEKVELIDSNNVLVKIIPLANWRARDKDDFGIMLLEMWAYICDSLSFYDEVLANEAYLRTSFLRPNLRKLIALLGYLPRPAVGSVVELAAIADGRLLLKLPVGTGFRSGAFDGNPPQVFELADEAIVHPFTNKMGIRAPHHGKILTTHPDSLLVELKSEIKEEAMLLLINKADNKQNKALQVKKVEKYTGIDNRQYNKISFTAATALKKGALLKDLQLLKPTLQAGLWTTSKKADSINNTKITLNVLSYQIHAGDYILMAYRTQYRWFKVAAVAEVMKASVASSDMKINGNVFNIPGIQMPVTELTLEEPVNPAGGRKFRDSVWDVGEVAEIIVYFGMQLNANVIDEPNAFLTASDSLFFDRTLEIPVENYNPQRFLMQDKNTLGAGVDGSISYDENKLTLNQASNWATPLTLPVDVYGNIITASRGETVNNEKMGSGNASIPSQTFKLKKKPLSYYPSPTVNNDNSVKNSLTVYVDGILWSEVNSFYGMKEYDQVYIVRQNDEGESLITFGDGIRGQRLPTGTDNIICNYRFGAEAACPPAGSVSQISKPVKGLRSVKNFLAAYGGADAEDAENMRTYAPKSALILGRVVSMQDMAALASSFPGVRAVQTEWRWDKNKQRASAHIFYIGDAGIRASLSQRIRSVSDPSTPITIETALSRPLFISINVKIDPRYLEEDVIKQLRETLTNNENGLLAPENIGIGLPLYRSSIFENILNVAGTEAVQSILIAGNNFGDFAIVPSTGYYFDIERGSLIINGKEN
jgi:hypothetical protein